jgi:hypothetical protein
MKKIIVLLFVMSAVPFITRAAGFEDAVKKGIELLKSSTTPENSVAATNYFERLSAIHPGEWLPLYYAAYGSLKTGLQQEDPADKDASYQKGLQYILKAKAIRENESEIYAMEAYLTLMYISNDAMKRAPSQTAAAMQLIEKSKALNPANPRPWFVHGQNTFFTPAFFGGGTKTAKPLLEKSTSLYASFVPANDLMPDWGKERCLKLLEQCDR